MSSYKLLFLKGLEFPVDLDSVPMPYGYGIRLAVAAPHPDDFDAICVTLRKLSAIADISVCVASSGASGVQDSFVPGTDPLVKGACREIEQISSCKFFGLKREKLSFLRMSEDSTGAVCDTPENRALLFSFLNKVKPHMIFLPHWNDTNKDHRLMNSFVESILQNEFAGKSIAVWWNRDPKTIEMNHDIYSFFSDSDAEWKSKMLRLHVSQHVRNLMTRGQGFDDRILSDNLCYAGLSPLKHSPEYCYSEVFALKITEGDSFS